jgi:AbrB family looped-hinge helix DNA binding protein
MANVTYLTLDKKGRATLPEEVREALGVGPGDFVLLERTAGGGYELVAAELVPKDQKWFSHPEMQERVRAAEEEILAGTARRGSAAELARRLEGFEGSAGIGAKAPPKRVSRTRPKTR